MNKENTTEMNIKINLPALKKSTGGIAVKKEGTDKKIAALDLGAMARKNSVSQVLKKDSLKQNMQNYQQQHSGLDLVLMGDLTGSMSSYYTILKDKFREICGTLFQIIPNLRIGIIFYLDHESGDPYITKVKKLSSNVQELQEFIDLTCCGNGGDADEAVEDALHDALEMNWGQYSKRSIVLFGDACPHEPNQCPYGFSYFNIVEQLFKKNAVINSVFCNPCAGDVANRYEIEIGDFTKQVSRLSAADFFSWIANVTGGVAIGVDAIDDIIDIIKAMAAKDAGKFEELETELKK